jgi:hypothetical protein
MNAEIIAKLQGSYEPSIGALPWTDVLRYLEEEAKCQWTTVTIKIGYLFGSW